MSMSATLKKGTTVIKSVSIPLDRITAAVAPGTCSMKMDISVMVYIMI